MNKLNKPKAFEASESMTTQSGIEIANLLRSGIKNQSVILVGHNQKWHEIEIESLRIDEENFLENSHLESAAHYIDTYKISSYDMRIIEEEIRTDYSLKHQDFLDLEKEFPKHSYVEISKLNDYEKIQGGYSGKFTLRMTLRAIDQQYLSIDGWISAAKERKESMLKSSNTTLLESLEEEITEVSYEDVVNTDTPQQAIIVDTVPVPVPVPSDSVSLQIFEKLTPEKITELQGLRITQEEIVKANPVVIIKDKKTYAEAKKVAAILLSASTAIDGSKGVEATATKYLNTFKTMLKTALLPIAKLTREPYDKQKKLIEDWDNRLLLQAQNRVKELFAVPFTYNSESDSYSVGSLVVTQKDIEEKNDADFSALVAQGKAIIIALESVKNEQDSKIAKQEKQIAELKAMLEQLLPKKEEVNNVIFETSFEPTTEEPNNVTSTLSSNPFAPVSTQSIVDHQNSVRSKETEEKQYSLPNPNNKLLNELDLAHVSVLEEKQYLECREYYVQALSDAAEMLQDIFDIQDKTVVKSEEIKKLIAIWKS